jgi:hypothetical protein
MEVVALKSAEQLARFRVFQQMCQGVLPNTLLSLIPSLGRANGFPLQGP